MDNFDFDGKQSAPQRASLEIWDMLSIAVLVIMACIAGYFLIIFINPASSLNILPPQPVFDPFAPPTPTITPLQLQATWTPTSTIQPTPSDTPRPTFTPFSTNTPFSLVPPTKTPKPSTLTPTPKAPFSASSVSAIESTIIPHLQDAGCNWFGVGGTVDDSNNSPIIGIVLRLAGTLSGRPIELTTVSGVSQDYGKSGFEFVLGNTPLATSKDIYVQLLDQAGLPLSEKIFLTTLTDCKKNLILVRFKKNR